MVLALSANAALAQESDRAEEEVRALERAWLDAYENRDPESMDTIVGEDFTITFPDGSIQRKPELMTTIGRPRDPDSPSVKFRTEDVEARVYGDTVILISRVVAEYRRGDETIVEESRYTDT